MFYNLDGQYLLPNRQNGSNFITIEEKATLSCPSSKFSSLGDGNQDVIDIFCSKDNKFKTSQEENSLKYDYKDLSCSNSIIETINVNTKCSPKSGNGHLVYIGWKYKQQQIQNQVFYQ